MTIQITMTATSSKGDTMTLEAECSYNELPSMVAALCAGVVEFHAKLG